MAAKKYSAEFKDALVQEVIRDSKSIAKVARENGVVEQKLRNWVTVYRKKNPVPEPELTESERAKLKRLEADKGLSTVDLQRRRQLSYLVHVRVGGGFAVGLSRVENPITVGSNETA